jgi:hypothetical protein
LEIANMNQGTKGTGTARKRRGNIVAQLVEECEFAAVDRLIAACDHGKPASEADKEAVRRWLAKAEARSQGKAA